MVTLSRRGALKPEGLSFADIREYVSNPDAFEKVKAELGDLMSRADVVIAEANSKSSQANELMQKAIAKAENNEQFAAQLSQRQQRMETEDAERKSTYSRMVADLNGKIRLENSSIEEANKRAASAVKREADAAAALDRANRESVAANTERLRYMAMSGELRATLEKHG